MHWDSLRYVLAVARAGTLSGAAQQLHVNETTVSRRLKALEQSLAAPLFVRSRSALLPTDAGKAVIDHAEKMELEALALTGSLRDTARSPKGLVRVATMHWLAARIIVPNLPGFADAYGEIELELITTTRERSLSRREAEMALRFEMPLREREVRIDLGSFSYSAYAPRSANPADLHWIGFGEDVIQTRPGRWVTEKLLSNEPASLRLNDVGMIYQAIKSGLGKGLIPDVLGAGDPALVQIDGDKPEMTRTLSALVHRDVRHDAAVVAVLDWMKQLIANTVDVPKRTSAQELLPRA